jgi:hypothetical protein
MPDQSSVQGLTGVLALQVSWFTLSAAPTMVRVTDSLGGGSTSGFGDLPVSLAVEHDVSGAWSPDLGAALDLTLPTGSTQTGIGSGQTSSGVDVGVGVSPVDPLHIAVNASRDLSGGTTGLVTTGATWIGGEAAWSFAERWTSSLSLGGEVGSPDSATGLVGFGVRRELGGKLALAVDGAAGLTAASPKWLVSVSFGTAFNGFSPVGLTTTFGRFKRTFGASAARAANGVAHAHGRP